MENNAVEKWLDGLRQQPEYAAEGQVLDFIGACEVRRAELGLNYAELARRMGVSRAYISKLMGGTQQSSVGSLAKLAYALGCEVRVELVLPSTAARRRAVMQLTTAPSKRNSQVKDPGSPKVVVNR
jgi:transcriptional regulator with XRE-family HTH domain